MRTLPRYRKLSYRVSLALSTGLFGFAPVAFGMPVQDTSARFDANLDTSVTNVMNITGTESSGNNILSWQAFSVAHDETVKFDNGAYSNNYLNIVTGANESNIAGTITGGKNVGIVNPNGVIITEGATVNVGNLYVSTQDLSSVENYVNNSDSWDGSASFLSNTAGGGEVTNLGAVQADTVRIVGDEIMFLNTADVTANNGSDTTTVNITGNTVKIGHPVTMNDDAVATTQTNDDKFVGHYTINGTAISNDTTVAELIDYTVVGDNNSTETQKIAQLEAINTANNTTAIHGAYYNGLAGNYFLGSDVDLNNPGGTYNDSTSSWAPSGSAPWTPIGADAGSSFKGTFDGVYHEISNFHVGDLVSTTSEVPGVGTFTSYTWDATVDYAGFFGYAENATIKNVGVYNEDDAGHFITGKIAAGGIVGYANNSNISNVYNDAYVKVAHNASNVTSLGGIAGEISGNTVISEAYNAGFVERGGIVGTINSGSSVINVYNRGEVYEDEELDDSAYGIAYSSAGSITNAYTDNGTNAVGTNSGTGSNVYVIDSNNKVRTNTSGGTDNGSAYNVSSYGFTDADTGESAISKSGNENTAWRIYEGHSLPMLRSFLRAKNGKVSVSGYNSDLAALTQDETTGDWSRVYNGKYAVGGASSATTASAAGSIPSNIKFSSSKGAEVDTESSSYGWGIADVRNVEDSGNGQAAIYITTQNGFEGYDLVGNNITITKRPLKITVTQSAKINADKIYDGLDTKKVDLKSLNVALSAAAASDDGTGLVSGDSASLSDVSTGTITYESKNVYTDNHQTTATDLDIDGGLTGTDAANYKLDTGDIKYEGVINPRPVYLIVKKTEGIDKVYDGTTYVTDSDVVGTNTDGTVLVASGVGDDKNTGQIVFDTEKNVAVETVSDTKSDTGRGFVTNELLSLLGSSGSDESAGIATVKADYSIKNTDGAYTNDKNVIAANDGKAADKHITYSGVTLNEENGVIPSNYALYYTTNGSDYTAIDGESFTIEESGAITRRVISPNNIKVYTDNTKTTELDDVTKPYDGTATYDYSKMAAYDLEASDKKDDTLTDGNGVSVINGVVGDDSITFAIKADIDGTFLADDGKATAQAKGDYAATKLALELDLTTADSDVLNNYTFDVPDDATSATDLRGLSALDSAPYVKVNGAIEQRTIYLAAGGKTDIDKTYDGTAAVTESLKFVADETDTNKGNVTYGSTDTLNRLVSSDGTELTVTAGTYANKNVAYDSTGTIADQDQAITYTVAIKVDGTLDDGGHAFNADNYLIKLTSSDAGVDGSSGFSVTKTDGGAITRATLSDVTFDTTTKVYDGSANTDGYTSNGTAATNGAITGVSGIVAVDEGNGITFNNLIDGNSVTGLYGTKDGDTFTASPSVKTDSSGAVIARDVQYTGIALQNTDAAKNYKLDSSTQYGTGTITRRILDTSKFVDKNNSTIIGGTNTTTKVYDNNSKYSGDNVTLTSTETPTNAGAGILNATDNSDVDSLTFTMNGEGTFYQSDGTTEAIDAGTATTIKYNVNVTGAARTTAEDYAITADEMLNNYSFADDGSTGLASGATLSGNGAITKRTIKLALVDNAADVDKTYNGDANVTAALTFGDGGQVTYASDTTYKLVSDDGLTSDGTTITLSGVYLKEGSDSETDKNVLRGSNNEVLKKNILYTATVTDKDGGSDENNYVVYVDTAGDSYSTTLKKEDGGYINPATATVNFTNGYYRTYDGTTAIDTNDLANKSYTPTVSGVNSETLNIAFDSAEFDSTDASNTANDRTITYKNITIADNDGYLASNYADTMNVTVDNTANGATITAGGENSSSKGTIVRRVIGKEGFSIQDGDGNTITTAEKDYDGTIYYRPDGYDNYVLKPDTTNKLKAKDANDNYIDGTGVIDGDNVLFALATDADGKKLSAEFVQSDNSTRTAHATANSNGLGAKNIAFIVSPDGDDTMLNNYTFDTSALTYNGTGDLAQGLSKGENVDVLGGSATINKRTIKLALNDVDMSKTYDGTAYVGGNSATELYNDYGLIGYDIQTDTDGNRATYNLVTDDAAAINARYGDGKYADDNTTISLTGVYLAENGTAAKDVLGDEEKKNITYTASIVQTGAGGDNNTDNYILYFDTNGGAASDTTSKADGGTILRREVSPVFYAGYSREYDGTSDIDISGLGTCAPTVSTQNDTDNTGVLSGESLVFANAYTASFDDKNATPVSQTNDRTITFDNLTLASGDNGTTLTNNYTLTATSGTTTGTINPRTITLAFANTEKTYDGTTDLTTQPDYTFGNIVDGEDLTLTSYVGTYDSKNAGTRTITYDRIVLGDGNNGQASNYALAQRSVMNYKNTITPKTINATLKHDTVTKTYDATTAVFDDAGNAVKDENAITLDDLLTDKDDKYSVTAAYADKNVYNYDTNGDKIGTDKNVTYTLTIDDGNNGNNYIVNYDNNALENDATNYVRTLTTSNNTITPRVLAVDFGDGIYKTYDGTADVTNTDNTASASINQTNDVIGYKFVDDSDNTDTEGIAALKIDANTHGVSVDDNGFGALNIGDTTKERLAGLYGEGTTDDTFNADANAGSKSVQYGNIQNALAAVLDSDADNYTINDTAYGTGTINRRQITESDITFNYASLEKEYDGTTAVDKTQNHTATITLTGKDNATTDVTINLTPTDASHYDDKNVVFDANDEPAATKQIDFTFTLDDSSDSFKNFIIGNGDGTLTGTTNEGKITPKTITASVAPADKVSKVYDATKIVYDAGKNVISGSDAVTLSDLVDGDENVSIAAYSDKNVGDGDKTVTYTVIINDGNGGRNYIVTDGTNTLNETKVAATSGSVTIGNDTDGTPLVTADANGAGVIRKLTTNNNTITAKDIVLQANKYEKTYDGTKTVYATPTINITDGKIDGDDVSVTNGYSAEYQHENVNTVGDPNWINYKSVAIEGADAGNYKMTYVGYDGDTQDVATGQMTGEGTINKRTIKPNSGGGDTELNVEYKLYDTNPVEKVYDGKTAADLEKAQASVDNAKIIIKNSNDNVISTINIELNVTDAVYDNENVGENKNVTYTFELGGDDYGLTKRNFAIDTSDGNLTDTNNNGKITTKDLVVYVLNDYLTKIYDADNATKIDETNATSAQLVSFTDDAFATHDDDTQDSATVNAVYTDVNVYNYDTGENRITTDYIYDNEGNVLGGNKTVRYTLTVDDGNDGKNYKVTIVNAANVNANIEATDVDTSRTFTTTGNTITPKALTLTFDPLTKTYDGSTEAKDGIYLNGTAVAPNPTLSEFVNDTDENNVALDSSYTAQYDTANAGTNKTITYGNLNLTTSDAATSTITKDNYTLAGYTAETDGNGNVTGYTLDTDGNAITSRRAFDDNGNLLIALNYTSDDFNKVYDGSDNVAYDHTDGTVYFGSQLDTDARTAESHIASVTIDGIAVTDYTIDSAKYDAGANVGDDKNITYKLLFNETALGNFDFVTGANTNSTTTYYSDGILTDKTRTGSITAKWVRAYLTDNPLDADITKEYDGTQNVLQDVTNKIAIDGLVDGVTLDTSAINAAYASKDVAYDTNDDVTTQAVTYNVALTDGSNYKIFARNVTTDADGNITADNTDYNTEITQLTGTGKITPRTLTVDFGRAVREYNGTATIGTDSFTVTGGDGKIVLATGGVGGNEVAITLNGADVSGETITLDRSKITGIYYADVDANGVPVEDSHVNRDTNKNVIDKGVYYTGIDDALTYDSSVNIKNYTIDATKTYAVADNGTGNGRITPQGVGATVTSTWGTFNKTYDATRNVPNASSNFSLTAKVGNIEVPMNYTISSAAYDNKNVGTTHHVVYTLSNLSDFSLNGATAEAIEKLGDFALSAEASTGVKTTWDSVEDGGVYGTITPYLLKASIGKTTNINKTYDSTTNADTGNITITQGLLAADRSANTITVTGNYDSANASENYGSNEKTVTYRLAVSGDDAGNYTFIDGTTNYSLFTGKGDIGKRTVYVGFKSGEGTGIDKEYDGTTNISNDYRNIVALEAADENTGIIEGDMANFSTGSMKVRYEDANVSRDANGDPTTKNVYYQNFKLLGADADNYELEVRRGRTIDGEETLIGKGTITPREIGVTLKETAIEKEYDGTTAVVNFTDANGVTHNYATTDNIVTDGSLVGRDTLNLSLLQAPEYRDGNAGSGIGVDYFLKWDNTNYELVRVDASGVEFTKTASDTVQLTSTDGIINPRTLTANVSSVAEKIYDGTTDVTDAAANINISRIVEGDDVGLLVSGRFDNANAAGTEAESYAAHDVTYDLTISNPNYKLADDSVTGLGYIYRKEITAVADPMTIMEGDSMPTFTGKLFGLVGGSSSADGFDFLADTSDVSIGTYGIWGWYGGATSGNYGLNYTFGQSEANASALTVSPFLPGDEYMNTIGEASHFLPDAQVFENASFDSTDYTHDSQISVQYAGSEVNIFDQNAANGDASSIATDGKGSVVNLSGADMADDISEIGLAGSGTVVNLFGGDKENDGETFDTNEASISISTAADDENDDDDENKDFSAERDDLAEKIGLETVGDGVNLSALTA